MTEEAAEILLVEDSAGDAGFFVHTFNKAELAARRQIMPGQYGLPFNHPPKP